MKVKLVLFVVFLNISVMLFAQEKPGNIQDDIEIMETILDKLFDKQERSLRFITSGTSGFYLDGYGILFKVPYSLSQKLYYVSPAPNARKFIDDFIFSGQGHAVSTSNKEAEKRDIDFEKTMVEEISRVKDISARFLGDYISAINYMEPNYWITVIVDFNGAPFSFDKFLPEKSIRQVIGKVQRKSIIDYHKGKIDFEKLKKQIQFVSKYDNDTEMDGDVEIFADIISSYVEKSNKENELHVINAVKGFYLDGYGAIFFMNVNLQPNYINIITHGDHKSQFSVQAYSSFGDRDTIDFDEKLNILQNRIISLYARFGHTLKKLQPKDWLEVAVNLNTIRINNGYSKVIYRIQKEDIDRLNSQKIKMTEFKKQLSVAKY